MEDRARAGVETDKRSNDPVTDPHAHPGLPPRQSKQYHRGYDHPPGKHIGARQSLRLAWGFQRKAASAEDVRVHVE